jgi:hypothetical protein
VPYASEPDLLVLHALRLKGFAEADVVAADNGMTVDEVTKHLDAFADDGLVRYRSGRVSGWALTGAGRTEGERRLAEELVAAGAADGVRDAYERFLAGNADMLGLCTDWQVRDVDGAQVVNDHADPDHDAAVIARLARAHEAVVPVTADLADMLERFGSYGGRLQNALDRVRAGEVDWFTKPTIDSYHTIWFELHENLLATLGIARGSEKEN